MSYTVQITWGVGGSLSIQPIVFIKLPEGVEASGGGGQRALLEAIAEISGWGDHKAQVLGGSIEPGVMVTVNAAHFGDKAPRYIGALVKRLTTSGLLEGAVYNVEKIKSRGDR